MIKYIILTYIVFLFTLNGTRAQKIYSIDASAVHTSVKSGHFKMGGSGEGRRQLLINSRYITLGGVPIVPVMGELQFSRVPRSEWEDRILKMKACGVNIISTYVIWIHHEEIEGQFTWSGNKDLRSFMQLCAKHNIWVYPRIGPWAHGEVRNGGTPDWILRKKNLVYRSNDPVYQQYVDRYFHEIGLQFEGLLYKEGGPVVGIQLENEYTRGKEGEPHIMWLKEEALKYGMDVPMYSVTGWGDGSVPPQEVIPLWGGYPDEPWDFHIEKVKGCGNFQFSRFRDDTTIGNELAKRKQQYMDYSLDPYFTCEMGVGVQNTYHRRLIISPIDGLGMITARVGSGSNLLGYYVFSGGTNPPGILSGMEEDKDESGYWSENAKFSYDFQAAIKESGQLAPSYYEVKKFNYFLNEFGSELAPMEPVFAQQTEGLQYAVRAKDNSAFLFGINYCRNYPHAAVKQVQFSIRLKNETVLLPSKPVMIADSSIFIWPVNLAMENTIINYITAQPLCKLKTAGEATWIFVQDILQSPECCISADGVERLSAANGNVINKDGRYLVTGLKPGMDCIISIAKKDGSHQKIMIISKEQGRKAWILAGREQKHFYLSGDNLYLDQESLHLFGGKGKLAYDVLDSKGVFTHHEYAVEEKKIVPEYKQQKTLALATWLKCSVKELNSDNLLYHKLFMKEFSVGNPSGIKSAMLVIAPELNCRLQLNDIWMANQQVKESQLNQIDITGYLRKGENTLLLDFPFNAGDRAFAARIIIEYFNSDAIDLYTDRSWLVSEQYNFPSPLTKYPSAFVAPEIVAARKTLADQSLPGFSEWLLQLPCNFLAGLSNLYLSVNYAGNKARCRYQYQVLTDNFNANVPWEIGLGNAGHDLGCRTLKIEIFPLNSGEKILFDKLPLASDTGKTGIKDLRFIPEYKVIIQPGSERTEK